MLALFVQLVRIRNCRRSETISSGGFSNEKYPFEVLSIAQNEFDTIIVIDDGGNLVGARQWLLNQAGKNRLSHVFSQGDFPLFASHGPSESTPGGCRKERFCNTPLPVVLNALSCVRLHARERSSSSLHTSSRSRNFHALTPRVSQEELTKKTRAIIAKDERHSSLLVRPRISIRECQ